MQNSLEFRLEQLEQQLKRQKITMLALVVGALVAISATRVVSQNSAASAAREMTLRTLKIVGSDGKVKVLISGDTMTKDGGGIAVFNQAGQVRLGLMATSQGGNVSVLGDNGEPMAILGFDGDGGSLGLSAKDSKSQVNIAATKNVAGLVASGPNGKKHLVASADKSGGVVQLSDSGGKLVRQLP